MHGESEIPADVVTADILKKMQPFWDVSQMRYILPSRIYDEAVAADLISADDPQFIRVERVKP